MQPEYPATDESMADEPRSKPGVSEKHLDRELIELFSELRVALPGVQVLYAFLLVVPFQATFGNITALDRGLYFLAFMSTTAASVLFIAPTTYHRVHFHNGDKQSLLKTANRMLVGGTVFLGIAIVTVGFLIADVLYGSAVAGVATALIAAWVFWFWYGIPLSRRAARRTDPGEDRED